MAGLVPAIPARDALCPPKRDARDQPAHAAEGCEGTAGACPLPQEQLLGSPTYPRTLHLLAAELVEVAALVPAVAPAPLPEPEAGPEIAPPPRPVNPSGVKAPEPGPEWQALRPAGELPQYVPPEPKPDPRLLDVQAEDEDGEE